MGNYVHLKTKVLRLKKDTPTNVIAFIDAAFNSDNSFLLLPDHKLFKLDRWDDIFHRSGIADGEPAYFKNDNGTWKLYINCEINYGCEEVFEFTKWITPYITGHKPKEYIGFAWFEQDRQPTNIYIERPRKPELGTAWGEPT